MWGWMKYKTESKCYYWIQAWHEKNLSKDIKLEKKGKKKKDIKKALPGHGVKESEER